MPQITTDPLTRTTTIVWSDDEIKALRWSLTRPRLQSEFSRRFKMTITESTPLLTLAEAAVLYGYNSAFEAFLQERRTTRSEAMRDADEATLSDIDERLGIAELMSLDDPKEEENA